MSTGFFITSLSGKLKRIKEIIHQHVIKKLYIYVSLNKNQGILRNKEWVSKKIVEMYSSSYQLFPNLDVRVILNDIKLQEEKLTKIKDYNVDVVIMPTDFDQEKFDGLKNDTKNLYVIFVDELSEDESHLFDTDNRTMHQHVVLGGTFDRLHLGHKILITEALLRSSQKLTVGVTNGEGMLKDKKLWELIEPCDKRIKAVENFIKEVDGSIEYNVVAITDMYGPTATDQSMGMIVVSSETQNGGLKVNFKRKENFLNPLDIHVVNLIGDLKRSNEEEDKISSSNFRMRLLGSYLKKPECKLELPKRPYIIGLTGGVASGKSTICQYLKSLGAAVIDCDKVGHGLYKCGTKIYDELIETFGPDIVGEDQQIDRRVLGSIVFKDQNKLDTLNKIMWPAILKAAKEECERLYLLEKKNIVVLEAAVLIKAGWHKSVHEVWATVIPRSEAIKRIMKRDNLKESEAESRINAQSSNADILKVANIVFCTLWSYDFTKKQVQKAWYAIDYDSCDTTCNKNK